MCAYVNYPFKRVPKMAGGGATPWGDIASGGAAIGAGVIDAAEGDYPTAWGGAGSGALSGAAAGSFLGPPGALVGAVVGGVAGFFGGQAKEKAAKAQRDAAMQQRQEAIYAAKLSSSRSQLQSYPTQGLAYAPMLMAEGGTTPITPLNIRNPTMTPAFERRKGRIAVSTATDRMSDELFNQQATSKATQQQNTLLNLEQSKNAAQTEAAPRFVNQDFLQSRANEGSSYVKSWLTQKGRGNIASQVSNPILTNEKGLQQLGFDAGGVYTNDQSYVNVDRLSNGRIKSAATEESMHDAQASLLNDKEQQNSLATLKNRTFAGTSAYLENPIEEQARLMRMRQNVNQTANQPFNRGKWRVNNFLGSIGIGGDNAMAHLAFKEAKSAMGRKNVFQSLNDTFANGGMVNPMYKAEGGEVIEHAPSDIPATNSRGTTTRLSNDTSLIEGDKHSDSSGGITMSNQAPARIYSDQLHASPALLKRLNHF